MTTRHHTGRTAAWMLAALLVAPAAHALVYRCELPAHQDGGSAQVRYQSQPCDGGQALNHSDVRTQAQQADTHRATQASAKLGQQLERDRRRQEKQGQKRRPVALDDPGKPHLTPTASSTQGQTLKREHPFTARVPKARKSS